MPSRPSAAGGTFQTLAEHFDGTSWSVVPAPALNAALSGVADAAGNNVWAVGNQAQGNSFVPVIEHWDGTSWSIVSSLAFTGVSISAGAVSADSATDVWVVGFLATSSTTAENVSLHWGGTNWAQNPAAHLRFGGVVSVAALSPANVWAVGTGPGVPTGGFSAHPTAVIEHWDGASWSVVPSPNPNPQGNNGLVAVAAVSASDVWAVGHQLQGPFTEHWNGKSWSIVNTPSGISFFAAMAASGGGPVLAVGQGTNSSGIILSN